jgi:type II secretory pathway pseudopilin PulG
MVSDGKKIRGFTLTEMAIVLGVASAVIGAIWGVAGSVKSQRNNLDAANELQTIKQNIIDMRGGHSFNVTGTNSQSITGDLIAAGVIPSNYISNTGGAVTPWGTNLEVYDIGPNILSWILPAPIERFRISFYNLPTFSSCMNLILQGTNCDAGQNGCPLVVYTIKSAYNKTPDPAPGGWQQVLTKDVVKALCLPNFAPDGTPNSINSVEFDYAW